MIKRNLLLILTAILLTLGTSQVFAGKGGNTGAKQNRPLTYQKDRVRDKAIEKAKEEKRIKELKQKKEMEQIKKQDQKRLQELQKCEPNCTPDQLKERNRLKEKLGYQSIESVQNRSRNKAKLPKNGEWQDPDKLQEHKRLKELEQKKIQNQEQTRENDSDT